MSDNMPFDIQMEIIKKVSVKSLIKFRSVSKAWKSLIDSSRFIKHYSSQQHLLVWYEDKVDYELNYGDRKFVSIVDDDTFPQQKVSPHIPLFVKMLESYSIVGSSHGLLCLECQKTRMAVVWNISIRKAVAVAVPSPGEGIYEIALGFGVCRETMNTKIVKIRYIHGEGFESVSCIPRQVEVFTLCTGTWRSLSNNLPRKSLYFCSFYNYNQIAIDGVFYWLAIDRTTIHMDGGIETYNMIISFDMTSEQLSEVNLPYSLAAYQHVSDLFMYKLRDSLAVLERCVEPNNPCFIVWMMEDGVLKSFRKLFTFVTPKDSTPYGLRKSGEPIIKIRELEDDSQLFVVYGHYLKHIDNIGIDGLGRSFSVWPYMEHYMIIQTLLLITKVQYNMTSSFMIILSHHYLMGMPFITSCFGN